MRNLIILAALMVQALSACAGSETSRDPFAYGVQAQISEQQPFIIEVRVRDPLPIAQATLIDDNGKPYPANELQRDKVIRQSNSSPWPSWGFSVFGGSSSHVGTGFGVGIPFFGGSGDQTVSVNESLARFAIVDSPRYASTWQSWKIRLLLDDGRTNRSIEMLPPAPPPSP